jgi:hypothetical protein
MVRVGSHPGPEVSAVEGLLGVAVEQEHALSPYAPAYAHQHATSGTGDDNRVQVLTCEVAELRAHPCYIRHKLAVPAIKLSALEGLGDFAFSYPLVITRDRFIIDGYGRWELAKRKGRPTVNCIERDLTSEEALEELIRSHGGSHGLIDSIRIELALDLEPYFRENARMNQQAGGKGKGSSRLTTAQRIDARREVARLAGVSCGNVRKVKNILRHACSPLMDAARTKEVSINLADKWSHEPPERQQEYLRLLRIERGIRKTARSLVAGCLTRVTPPQREDQMLKLLDLVGCLKQLTTSASDQSMDASSIEVQIIKAPGRTIFVTQELACSLMSTQRVVG